MRMTDLGAVERILQLVTDFEVTPQGLGIKRVPLPQQVINLVVGKVELPHQCESHVEESSAAVLQVDAGGHLGDIPPSPFHEVRFHIER